MVSADCPGAVSVSWGLCMPVCVCVIVSMYVCIYIHLRCMLVFMCICALCMCMCACLYVCAHVSLYACICVNICVYLCCVCTCVNVFMCANADIGARVCMNVRARVCLWDGLRVCVTGEKNSACPRDSGGARYRACVSGFLGVGRCACLQASCPRTAAPLSDWLQPRQSEAPESCGNLVTW